MTNSTMKRLCATALLGLLLSTTAVPAMAQDLGALAVRGEALAAADPLAARLRSQLDDAGRLGFDIGMGAAEGNTLPGPGKQDIHDRLPTDQQPGYASAVLFSITRNANLTAANIGARMAQADSALADARQVEDDPFYSLGFDIATGLLDDRSETKLGEFTKCLGPSRVHQALVGATQRGFAASAGRHGCSYGSNSAGSTAGSVPPGDFAATEGGVGDARVGSVPNVVGMSRSEAVGTLTLAGFKFAEAEINIGPAQPPYDHVLGTRPSAGTTLPQQSTVLLQFPRAWMRRGGDTLTGDDFVTRLGFDFDSGKRVNLDDGADIYARHHTLEGRTGYGDKLVATQIHLATGVRVVNVDSYTYEIGDRRTYEECIRALREKSPTNIGTNRGDLCIETTEGRIARIRVDEEPRDGTLKFTYVTFAANGTAGIRPVGRVYGPNGPVVSKLTKCEAARGALNRNSPAAPGLVKQCLDGGGTVPPQ